MAGLLRTAEHLVPKIQKMLEEARNFAGHQKELGNIGRVFMDARKTPGYFETEPSLISNYKDLDELVKRINDRYGFEGSQKLAMPGTMGETIENGDGAMAMRSMHTLRNRDRYMGGDLTGSLKGSWGKMRGDADPDVQPWVADTMALSPGGGGRDFYKGLYDFVLSQPGATNISTGLSDINSFRRTANMAPVYERYGDRANRIVVDSDQLSSVHDGRQNWGKVRSFHQMPTESQVGLLNSIITQRAAHEQSRVAQLALKAARQSDPGTLSRTAGEDALRKFKELKLDPESPWMPSTDVDESQLRGLARLMQTLPPQMGVGRSSIGYDSLRRAAIASDSLEGITAADLRNQPWLTEGLGRKAGGSIPTSRRTESAGHQGPLSNLWR